MNTTHLNLPTNDQQISNSLEHCAKILTLLNRTSHWLTSIRHSALDIIEALDLTHQVIKDRLSVSNINEWKNDDKQQYKALYTSIEEQVKETIHLNFAHKQQQSGFLIGKFNELFIEELFQIISKLSPTDCYNFIDPFLETSKQYVLTDETEIHPDDALVAKTILVNLAKSKRTKPTRMTRKQRLDLIARVVEQIQETQEVDDTVAVTL